jgi:hypothetical protein
MSGRSERGTAIAVGMSGHIVTPDSSLPDRLDGYPAGESESELE